MTDYGYGTTLIDMTPPEVGRHPEFMAEVASVPGCNVVAITGFFPERMGVPYYGAGASRRRARDFFVRDLTEGMVFAARRRRHQGRGDQDRDRPGERDAQPGRGPNGRHVHEVEDRILRAAGPRAGSVGCGINTHTDPMDFVVTNPGIEQLEILDGGGWRPRQGDHRARLRAAAGRADAWRSASAAPTCSSTTSASRGGSTAEELDESMANALVELIDDGYLYRIVISFDRWFFNLRATGDRRDPACSTRRSTWATCSTAWCRAWRSKGFTDT